MMSDLERRVQEARERVKDRMEESCASYGEDRPCDCDPPLDALLAAHAALVTAQNAAKLRAEAVRAEERRHWQRFTEMRNAADFIAQRFGGTA